ncbi:MAG TPA: tyrosine--tRNA ligase [candidate division Zixibacteria bacterium]|nr:tyrosine--tRNA ligase [candidate division Zixibacteria bacterium]
MNISEKVNLVTRNTDEVVTKEELKALFERKKKPNSYIGFELSGRLHIGNGLMCAMKMHDLVDAGANMTIFLADWHSWVNNKLDGDLDKIKIAGEYFKAGYIALGLTEDKVKYRWSSELVQDSDYWATLIKVAKSTSLNRILRALPIMGRNMESKDIESAWIYYPAMQAADIFYMDIDIAYGGMDQRKAHMITRDCAKNLGKPKPVAVHTPLLTGLTGSGSKMDSDADPDIVKIEAKMSKSKPETCIFIHDTEDDIKRKLKIAFCPAKVAEGNPVTEICKYVLFAKGDTILKIERPAKFGGDLEYKKYSVLEKDYIEGKLHPLDLKNAVAKSLGKILEPVHKYFDKHPERLEALDKMITGTKNTR